jgi:serine/threonine protein phosphatase 1
MPRTLAIGDIHGSLTAFDALLAAVKLTPDDHLVLLGDYVDRGPDSKGVLQRIIEIRKKRRVTAIMGNHEEMMLAARSGDLDHLRDWVLNGGMETLFSYGGDRATLRDVPAAHWHFLSHDLVDYLETDTHLFVHAGCQPNLPLSQTPDAVLRWERCDRVQPHQSGKIIVCGHTPQPGGMPMNKGFAICLDTAAGYGEFLTCLDVHSGKLWQSDTAGKIFRLQISDFLES